MARASTVGLVWAALLLAPNAHGEPASPPANPDTQLRYTGYVAGLNVFTFYVKANIAPDRYRMQTRYHTDGLLSAFVSGELHTMAQGTWQAGRAAPSHYQTWGTWRDETRDTQIDYVTGKPVIRKLIPPIDGERDAVPAADQVGAIDTLSAFADLTRQVNATGRCEAAARLFDGRRLSLVTVGHGGDELLTPEPRSGFTGHTLRCDITSRQIGGFVFGERTPDATRPTTGSLWFARPAPGAMMVPVRMSFDLHLLGHATMYLTPNPK